MSLLNCWTEATSWKTACDTSIHQCPSWTEVTFRKTDCNTFIYHHLSCCTEGALFRKTNWDTSIYQSLLNWSVTFFRKIDWDTGTLLAYLWSTQSAYLWSTFWGTLARHYMCHPLSLHSRLPHWEQLFQRKTPWESSLLSSFTVACHCLDRHCKHYQSS